jgi:hypothetical protein
MEKKGTSFKGNYIYEFYDGKTQIEKNFVHTDLKKRNEMLEDFEDIARSIDEGSPYFRGSGISETTLDEIRINKTCK